MEISFYVLLVLACLVLLLAMWACAGSNTQKWGPDLTLELPPHLLQEALFGPKGKLSLAPFKMNSPSPSAPSDLPCDPLLSNEHQMGHSNPPTRYHRPAPKPPVLVTLESNMPPRDNMEHANMSRGNMERANMSRSNMEHANMARGNMEHGNMVRVLPSQYAPAHKLRPVFHTFTAEERA